MKTVAVKVMPVSIEGKPMWNCNCCTCHTDMIADDLRGALRLARRHIRECKKPGNSLMSWTLSQPWPHWIIGFM